jgi:hypothetical protein
MDFRRDARSATNFRRRRTTRRETRRRRDDDAPSSSAILLYHHHAVFCVREPARRRSIAAARLNVASERRAEFKIPKTARDSKAARRVVRPSP